MTSSHTPPEPSAADPDASTRPSLKRALGPGTAIAIVVGNVIGAGIFLKPTAMAKASGDFSLMISGWLLGGVVCMFGALCFAELASMLPHAGGLYVFLREAYGKCMAFLFGLNEYVFGRTATNGALAIICASTGLELVSGSNYNHQPWIQALVACGVISLLAGINILGVAWGGRVQSSTTLVKAGFLGVIALLPFVMLAFDGTSIQFSNYSTTVLKPELATTSAQFAAIFFGVMWAYNGWHDIAPVAEEVRNPQRNIPLSLILGTGLIMLLYVSVNLAYHGALTMTEIATQGDNTADVMIRKVLASSGAPAIRFGSACVQAVVLCSIFGALNCNLLLGPRIAFAMARDGIFWRPLADVHRRFHTPAVSILTQAIVSCSFVLVVTALIVNVQSLREMDKNVFEVLTNFVVYSANIFYALCVLGVFVLRIRHPEWHRPYRTWGYPLVPIFYLLVMGWFSYAAFEASPFESSVAVGLMLLGLPLYAVLKRTAKPH